MDKRMQKLMEEIEKTAELEDIYGFDRELVDELTGNGLVREAFGSIGVKNPLEHVHSCAVHYSGDSENGTALKRNVEKFVNYVKQLGERGFDKKIILAETMAGHLYDTDPSLDPEEFNAAYKEQFEGYFATVDSKGRVVSMQPVVKDAYTSEKVKKMDDGFDEIPHMEIIEDGEAEGTFEIVEAPRKGFVKKYLIPIGKAAGKVAVYVVVPLAVAVGCNSFDKAKINDALKSFDYDGMINANMYDREPGEVIEPGNLTAGGNLKVSLYDQNKKAKKGGNKSRNKDGTRRYTTVSLGADGHFGYGDTHREINQAIQNGNVHTDYDGEMFLLDYSLFLDAENIVPLGDNAGFLFPKLKFAIESADNRNRGNAWTVVNSTDFGKSDLHTSQIGNVHTRRYKFDVDTTPIPLPEIDLLIFSLPKSIQFGFYGELIENRVTSEFTNDTSGMTSTEREDNSPKLWCASARVPFQKKKNGKYNFETSSFQYAWDRANPEGGDDHCANKYAFINYANRLGPIAFVLSHGYHNRPSTGNPLHPDRDDKWTGHAKFIVPMFKHHKKIKAKKARCSMDNYFRMVIAQGMSDVEQHNLRRIEDGLSFADQSFNPIKGFAPYAVVLDGWYSNTERGCAATYGISKSLGVGAAYRNVTGKEDEWYTGVMLKFDFGE